MGGKFRQLSLNRLHFVNFLLLLLIYQFQEAISSVSYDRKAIIINGKRRILFSGSIHYPRSVPEMWPDLIQKAKDGGLDVIQTYVFWSGHEPSSGKYNFEGRYDLVRFIKLVKQAGLYVHLRIGPYICAEWNFGGFPVWLKYVPGISFRTDNHPFKVAMRGFTEKIVDMMKAEGLFQWQGGPIIMSQIENEYGPVEYEIGAPGQAYTHWAAKMAVGLGTGVPWVMCKQDDVPDPVIDTCNGFYCENFLPSKPYKPKIWTEAWTGWFSGYGEPVPHRPVEDLAFAVAKFIQKGGSFVNYYMYHGGTNFGRTAGGKFVTTSYDYDAPIDEYGLLREPKWSHLRDLHKVIKLCEPALISGDPTIMPLGNYQEAHVFKTKSGDCAAFLANYNPNSFARVAFQDMHYNLPPWSISILPDCKITIFNTARVNSQTSLMKMASVDSSMSSWQSSNEEITSYDSRLFTALGLLEQMNTTRDSTDYLWYMTDVDIDPDELFLKNGQYPILSISSAGHTLQVFINEEYIGSAFGSLENPNIIFTGNAKMKAGINRISILSSSVGLPNEGIHYETWNAGVLGPVMLNGLNEGRRDLSWQKWTYKIGLNGEAFNLKSQTETPSIEWVEGSLLAPNQPLTWYKNYFDAPSGEDPLALDMGGMGKGQAWINGNNIGRYWPAYMSSGSCGDCNYTGTHNEKRCLTNCGEPSQRWYHVPRSWLKPKGNLLVVFEEWGGDPTSITLVKRTIGSVCANVHEWQPTLEDWKNPSHWKLQGPQRPTINLWCSPGRKISSIKFASFGTPEGECGNFQQGSCHAFHSYDTFEKNCIGQQWCNVTVSPEAFGGDPCPNIMKKLAVEALCE